ncbi:hypothetical protein G6O69_12500 [Pseudenhygromyxa sp. WMMC2535]|uniref:hypothetical protein n=1 Tax=Pseudenhygromyxa sp. WMMC2535 TaxID=2712867 RepID=UPI0015517C22|nr:hypothetical protein [Pseudenhygromyxa sp. WMMC2535]NVB38653.1 hypothetical protein [Pseudenhygromyxa sp. WMMC2535]
MVHDAERSELLLTLATRDPELVLALLRHRLDALPRDPLVLAHPLEALTQPRPPRLLIAHAHRDIEEDMGCPPRLAVCVHAPERPRPKRAGLGEGDAGAAAVEHARACAAAWAKDWRRIRASIGARLRCPAHTVVMTCDPILARAFAALPGSALSVIGPAQVPRVRDPSVASRRPALALLSSVVHGRDDRQVCAATLAGLAQVEDLEDGDEREGGGATEGGGEAQARGEGSAPIGAGWLEFLRWRKVVLAHAHPGDRAALAARIGDTRAGGEGT